MKKNAGFTLLEVLIVVAIIGILAVVAYPSYRDHVLRSGRSDGIAAIIAVQMAQERLRASCAQYAANLGGADNCGTSTVRAGSTSPEGLYTIGISGASGNGYTVTATPQGKQATDTACNPITLTVSAANPNGAKGNADCW